MSSRKLDLVKPIIKLTIFAVVTILSTSILAATIGGTAGEEGTEYSAIFTDATLAAAGDEVRISGVRVGHVTGVEVQDRTKARVNFVVSDRDGIPESTRATLRIRNLVGERYLALTRDPGPQGQDLPAGSTLGLDRTTPAVDLTELFNGFRPLFTTLSASDVNDLTSSLIKVLQGEGGTVTSLIQHTARLTNHLADRDVLIGEVITNLTQLLETLNERETQMSQLIVTTRQLVVGLAEEKDAIGESIESLADLTSSAENVVTATRPSVTGALAGLNEFTAEAKKQEDVLNSIIENLPVKTEKLARTGSYGSWFQFYLCGIDVMAGPGQAPGIMPPTIPKLNTPIYTNSASRCSRQDTQQ